MKSLPRQMMVCLVALAITVSFNASVASTIPKPDEVLKVATADRLQFIKVTNELQGLIPQIATKQELYPYIEMLPELLKISNNLDFAAYGADPVVPLAGLLTRNAVKWIRFDSDSREFLKTFFTFSDDQTRFSSAHLQTDFVKRAATKQALMAWNEGVSYALATVKETKAESWVFEQFEELQGQTVIAILKKNQEFTLDELGQVFQGVNGQMAMAAVFDFIQQKAVSDKDVEVMKKEVEWLKVLSGNVAKILNNTSMQIRLFPGQLLNELLGKVLAAGDTLSVEHLKPIFEIMMPTQWVDMGTLIVTIYNNRSIPSKQLSLLKELLAVVKAKYEEFNVTGRTEAIGQLVDRIFVAGEIADKDAEGIFDIQVGERKGVFILSSTGNGKHIIAFTLGPATSDEYEVDYGFFQVTANVSNRSFEAHHFAPGIPNFPHKAYQTWDMLFKISQQDGVNVIEGEVNNNLITLKFNGRQRIKFSPLLPNNGSTPKNLSGVFRGTLDDKAVELQLVDSGPNTTFGKLCIEYMNLPLNYGFFDPSKGNLVLTSGELDTYKWAQITGQFSPDGAQFEGYYILSGQPEVSRIAMKRVK